MSMLLSFPHITEEAGTHLFGVPHRHEHFCLDVEAIKRLVEAGQRPTGPASPPTAMRTPMKCASTSGNLLSAVPRRRR